MKKLLFVLVVILVIPYVWYRSALRPADASSDTRIQVEIAPGASTKGIAALLEKEGIIRSSTAFSVYARLHGSADNLQAGSFFLLPSMSVPEVIEALGRGVAMETTVTVPEGFTLQDIDALVAQKGLAPAGAVLECAKTCDFSAFAFLPSASNALAPRATRLEGYLYPDSYFVSVAGFTPESLLTRMLQTFQAKVVEGLEDEIQSSGHTLHETMTMASLVEEETRTDDERGVVAGILWKRLEEGISLGVDAAVRYIVNKPTAAITQADLAVDSPYNLRRFRGLPPGPIANPSLASIRATLSPEASPYYFYLHGNDGVIRYAVTNDEHNANKARYLQ